MRTCSSNRCSGIAHQLENSAQHVPVCLNENLMTPSLFICDWLLPLSPNSLPNMAQYTQWEPVQAIFVLNSVYLNSSQYRPVWSTLNLYLSQVLTLISLHFNDHIQQGPLRPTVILFHIVSLLDELCIFKLLPIWTSMVHSAPLSLSSTYTDNSPF